MTAQLLKKDFPQLTILSDAELETGIQQSGLWGAFIHAHIKRLSMPKSKGRPRKKPKERKVIQRRGRRGDRISKRSTNIQLAEMAAVYASCLHCSNTEAAKATIKELTGSVDPKQVRRLAKLMSEIPGRKHDKEATSPEKNAVVAPVQNLSSFSGLLFHTADLKK